jgi:hypothetical protein
MEENKKKEIKFFAPREIAVITPEPSILLNHSVGTAPAPSAEVILSLEEK